jgi:hypothetical protein
MRRWGRASRRRARTSGRGGRQPRVELGLVTAGVCAFKCADADADADGFGRSESALAVHGSPLARGILAREGYPDAADANEETGGLADRSAARGVVPTRPAPASVRSYSTATARGKVRGPPPRAGVSCGVAPLLVRARAPSTAGTGARRTGVARARADCAGGTNVAAVRAQLSSGPSSGTLPLLSTLADLRSTLAPADATLAVETLLAVDNVGYAEPPAFASAPDGPSGLGCMAFPVPAPQSAEGARCTSEAALRRRVFGSGRWPPEVVEHAENAAESVHTRGAGELCAFEYADAAIDALAGSLRRDALDALWRSENAPAIRGSSLTPSLRAHKAGLVDPDATDASEDTDKLADGSVERGAPDAGGVGERTRMLDSDGAGESARLAGDMPLRARGRDGDRGRARPPVLRAQLGRALHAAPARGLGESARARERRARAGAAKRTTAGRPRRRMTELGASSSSEPLQPGLVVSPSPPRRSASSRWRTRRRAVSRVSFWSRASSASRTSWRSMARWRRRKRAARTHRGTGPRGVRRRGAWSAARGGRRGT